jgi:hypothetical protein
MSLECVNNKEWLIYKSRDGWSRISEENKAKMSKNTKPENFLLEFITRIDSSRQGLRREQLFTYYGLHENCPNQGYHFVFVTDSLGRHLHTFNTNTRKILTEQNRLNYLIPVWVRQSKYFRDYAEDKIFWFTPTEEFFERLPDRIKGDIQNEYLYITKKSGTTGCVYFEECRTTLELSDFRVYPNPATTSVSVEFNNPKEMNGNISIVNILGSQVKVLLSGTSFPEGHNYYNLDLTGINPGIYLITIQTNKGLKTQRLIVTE